MIDFLEDRKRLRDALPRILAGEELRVVIGHENERGEMQECSLIVSRYGTREGVNGVVAVLGPTRLDYKRSIASVRIVADALGGLVGDLN